jgi:DNA-binding Xre family transcriptional regulator
MYPIHLCCIDDAGAAAMHATSRTRSFSKDQSGVILRTALRILEKWKATTEQAISILRVSRSSISRIQQGKGVELDCDQLERASIVLNCHASLRLVFDNPENVYGFVGMENHNDFFNGRKPLEIMAQGELMSLLDTYKQIVEFCGAGELISSSSPWGGLN